MGDKYAKGGSVKSASARADGCAIRGKTRAWDQVVEWALLCPLKWVVAL
jgi:hypothetical protein